VKHRRGVLAAAAVLVAVRAASAQYLLPATPQESLERARVLAELNASLFGAVGFVDRDGITQEISGLRIGDGALRISWAPVPHVAVGIEADYRASHLAPEGSAEAVTVSGLSGAGGLVLWSPSGARSRFPAVLTLGYFGAPRESDRILTVRDGTARLLLDADVASRPNALPHDWRAAADLSFQLGRGGRAPSRFYRGEVRLESGPGIAEFRGLSLHALALVGIRISSNAPQEGLSFSSEGSTAAFIGPVLQADSAAGWSAALAGTWNAIRVRNALKGWRAAAMLRRVM